MLHHALDGVRVLDFTRVLAGPLCTMLLGDMGADVIKVESACGDDTRHWGPPWAGEGDSRESAYYLAVNRNKRSIVLDLKSPADQDRARRLAAQSQIVVENFKPGGMAAFGLGYDDLRAINPALVYVSITGFGQNGPYRERPGYDSVIQGMSGLMSITGQADGPPTKAGVALSDVITGLFALSGLLAALRHAERTGEGMHLDIALYDSQVAALVNVASSALISGRTPSRHGSAHPNIVPYQDFAASDGAFMVAVGNDGQFAALCRVIDRPELAVDPRFTTNPARVIHRATLIPLLQDVFITRPAADWVEALLAAGIPAGPIQTVTEALDDPQIGARGLLHEVGLSNGEAVRLIGSPLLQTAIRRAPPALGQHTDEVLRELLGD